MNDEEPVPPFGQPAMPEWLSAPAQEIWRQVIPGLASIGLARTIDGLVLARYCEMLHLWVRACQFVQKQGPTYVVRAEPVGDQPGRILGVKSYPEAGEIRKLNSQLLLLEREFGLTPSARTRIKVDIDKKSKGDVNELKRQYFAGSAG